MTPHGWRADVYAVLKADPRRCAEHLFGKVIRQYTHGGNRELCFAGSHEVCISGPNRGGWTCWSAGQGGGLTQALEHARRLDREAAVRYAAALYDIRIDGKRPEILPEDRRRQREREEQRKAEAEKAEAADYAQRIGKAQAIWAATVPISGTLGDYYLTEIRKIPQPAGGWPDGVRGCERVRVKPFGRALVAAVTDSAGELTAVTGIFLDPQGRNIVRDGKKLKLTF